MGPEVEQQARSDGLKASSVKENERLCADSKDEPGGHGPVEADCQDVTESSCSSSFDGTASDSEDAINAVDDEDELNLFGNNSLALDITDSGNLVRVRRRKLSNHWRTFIQPLKWRCKWTELQVKKLKSFALRYDRKLTNNNRKPLVENFIQEAVSFPNGNPAEKLMKRKKRRRIGDEMNPTTNMSNHPLFSHFDKKMCIAPGASLEKGGRNQEKINGSSELGVLEEGFWTESEIGDNSLEEMFKEIELLQTKVRKQKSRLEQVKAENNKYKAAHSPASPPNNGTRTLVKSSDIPSQLTSLYGKGSVVKPKSAVLSHRKVSFSGVLEGKDRLNQAENDVLIYDERLKEGMKNYDLSIPMEKPRAMNEKLENTSSKALIEPEPQRELQQPLKVHNNLQPTAPKKRKKTGRLKPGPSKLQRTS